MLRAPLFAALLVTSLGVGCGDSHDGHTTTDGAVSHDGHDDAAADAPVADVAPDQAAPADAAGDAAAPTLNDCAPADYVDRSDAAAERVVRPRGSTGYTPRCVIVRAGQSLTFEMDFTAHPLVPGVPHGPTAGATTPNLIPRTTTGASVVVAFPGAGNFPFYCNTHGHVGMAGVVRVVP